MENKLFLNVQIETKRLLLRCFTIDDKEGFFQILQDTALYETLPDDHMYSYEEVDGIIEYFLSRYTRDQRKNVRKFALAIILKENGELIGDIGIGEYPHDKKKTEIFYFISSKYWNMGYVSEAAEALLSYVKSNKLAASLVAAVVEKNIASKKILLKNGFKRIPRRYDDVHEMYELRL